jgi:hypothetical protein
VQEMNYKDVVREFEADKSATRENIYFYKAKIQYIVTVQNLWHALWPKYV